MHWLYRNIGEEASVLLFFTAHESYFPDSVLLFYPLVPFSSVVWFSRGGSGRTSSRVCLHGSAVVGGGGRRRPGLLTLLLHPPSLLPSLLFISPSRFSWLDVWNSGFIFLSACIRGSFPPASAVPPGISEAFFIFSSGMLFQFLLSRIFFFVYNSALSLIPGTASPDVMQYFPRCLCDVHNISSRVVRYGLRWCRVPFFISGPYVGRFMVAPDFCWGGISGSSICPSSQPHGSPPSQGQYNSFQREAGEARWASNSVFQFVIFFFIDDWW